MYMHIIYTHVKIQCWVIANVLNNNSQFINYSSI